MMRIDQLVCTDNFAGVERHVATTSVELARRGHDVTVYGGNAAAMKTAMAGSTVAFVDAPGPHSALRAHLRSRRPDLVHAHMTAAELVAVTSRPLTRAPVVSTRHFAQQRGHDRLTRTLTAVIPHLVTAEIAISRFVADAVGGHPTIIPSGVPTLADMPTERQREPVVLVAQRLESEKATGLAIDAFARSGLAGDGWELHIAGAGSQRAVLEVLATSLDIGESTRFLGLVDDLDRRMGRASLLLATTPREAFGLSVVEAMASGLPVLAADGGAHRETIGSATPETLFVPGDADAAAALLRRFADDAQCRVDLASRGRRRHAEAFTIETQVDALEALYRRLTTAAVRRRHG